MKKILIFLMVSLSLFVIAGCTDNDNNNDIKNQESSDNSSQNQPDNQQPDKPQIEPDKVGDEPDKPHQPDTPNQPDKPQIESDKSGDEPDNSNQHEEPENLDPNIVFLKSITGNYTIDLYQTILHLEKGIPLTGPIYVSNDCNKIHSVFEVTPYENDCEETKLGASTFYIKQEGKLFTLYLDLNLTNNPKGYPFGNKAVVSIADLKVVKNSSNNKFYNLTTPSINVVNEFLGGNYTSNNFEAIIKYVDDTTIMLSLYLYKAEQGNSYIPGRQNQSKHVLEMVLKKM